MGIVRLFSRMAVAVAILQFPITWSVVAAGQSTPFLGRGATVEANKITEKDVSDFASMGGNLLRLMWITAPMQDMTPPHALNAKNLAYLDQDLDWCKKYNLRCVIDPQVLPGFQIDRHTDSDPIWHDRNFQDMLVNLWDVIAQRVASRGQEVAGFDLMNEAAPPANPTMGSVQDYNALVARIILGIRKRDKIHAVIIETPDPMIGGRVAIERAQTVTSFLRTMPDSNVIYSIHLYEPYGLTFEKTNSVKYPGVIDGMMWNANTIAQRLAPVVAFQKRTNAQIYVGEFSCARWGGDSGNRWLKDMMDFFEAHGWSWTYLAFPPTAPIWDAEKNNYDPNDNASKSASTPRMNLLRSYWKLNLKP